MKKLLKYLIAASLLSGFAFADSGDIPLSSNFQENSGRPLDSKVVTVSSTTRLALSATLLYDGMLVYQRSDHHTYQLQGSTSNWVDITNGGGAYPGIGLTDVNNGKWAITVNTSGHLVTTQANAINPGFLNLNPTILVDPCLSYWTVTVDTTSHLITTSSGSYSSSIGVIPVNDATATTWLISISTSGNLVTVGNGNTLPAVSCPNSSGAGGITTQVQYNNGGSFAGNSAMTFSPTTGLSVSSSTLGLPVVPYNPTNLVVNSTGTTQAAELFCNGQAGNSLQFYQDGCVNIALNAVSDGLVIQSSVADTQQGASFINIISQNPNYNDPKLWFHISGHNSSPEIRDDAAAPNWEVVNTSTDNAHGLGKFEPMAISYQGVDLQINSRAWDNSTFETLALWHALQNGGGLTLEPALTADDPNVIPKAAPLQWGTTDFHTVGLRGPDSASASWEWTLPHTPNNAGQLMWQTTNGGERNLEFTTDGQPGQVLSISAASTPTWTTLTAGAAGNTYDFQYKNPGAGVSGTLGRVTFDTNNNALFLGTTGQIEFSDVANDHFVAFKSSNALVGSTTWTLPDLDGSAGQVLTTLGSSGGHALTWTTPSSAGSPGGASFSVQYNSGGSFGGSSDFIYAPSQHALEAQTTAQIQFYESANDHFVGFRAQNSGMAGSTMWQLPIAEGSPGQFLQTTGTSGSDILQWANPSITLPLPQGATNYVQNSDILQAGTTFYVSSGTIAGTLTVQPTNAALAPLSVSTPSATSPALYVSTNAFIGIGTNNPVASLQIGSIGAFGASTMPSAIDMGSTFSSAAGSNLKLKLYDALSGSFPYGFGVSAGQMDLYVPSSAGFQFYVTNTVKPLFVNGTGVGIFNSAPKTALYLSSGVFTMDGTNSGIVINSSNTTQALLSISTTTALSPALYVSTNNWVGIGNANPLGPLDLISTGANRTIFTTVANTFEAMYMNTTTGNTNYLIASNGSSVDFNAVAGGSVNLQIGAQVKLGIIANGNVGIGTIAPVAKLEVSTGALKIDGSGATIQVLADSTTAFEFQASTTTNNFHVAISTAGHLLINGTSPVLTSCGGSPTITGADNAFRIVPGSAASGCTVTFNSVWGAAPVCTVVEETMSLVNALSYTVSTSALSITQTSLTSALDVICVGNKAP